MSLKFDLVSCDNYCTYITDGTHGTHSNQETGKYLLSAKDILNGNVHIKEDSRIISEEDFNKIHKNYKLENYDVLLTVAGTIGRTAIIRNYEDNYTFQRSVAIFKTNNKIKSLWLYYYLNSPIGKQIIKSLAKGTTQLILPLKDLRNLEIPVPVNIEDQKRMLSILVNIDNKIEINHKINKNLEEMIHVLFKRYFIDSNPFYVDNDEKWKLVKLKDFVIRNRDKIKEFDDWKDELLIDLSNMPRFSIALSTFDKGEKFTSNIYKLNKYDLLFGSIRPYFGKVGFSPIDGVVTGTVHSFKPIDDKYYSLILSLISSKTFINYTVSVSKGTKMPSVKWDDFIDYEFAIPEDINKIEEYNNLVLPFIEKIKNNILEIQRLTQLRDTLLPKLMSGEIDISAINYNL